MKILEQFVQSKTGRMETCEDAVFINDNFVAIIDGATNKTAKTWDGKAGGMIARDCVVSALSTMNKDVSAEQFFLQCNEAIKSWYDEKNITIEMQYHLNQRCTASLIAYSKHAHQIWIVGSGQAIIGNQHINNTKMIDDLLAELRSFYIAAEIKNGTSEEDILKKDPGREMVQPLILRQMVFQNSTEQSEWNYYELDGFFSNPRGINIIDIPEGVTELIMGSDGYPEIYPTLQATEKFLEQQLRDDPLCYKRYKATKCLQNGNVSFDDRSYVRFTI